jgi:hypothetical protein
MSRLDRRLAVLLAPLALLARPAVARAAIHKLRPLAAVSIVDVGQRQSHHSTLRVTGGPSPVRGYLRFAVPSLAGTLRRATLRALVVLGGPLEVHAAPGATWKRDRLASEPALGPARRLAGARRTGWAAARMTGWVRGGASLTLALTARGRSSVAVASPAAGSARAPALEIVTTGSAPADPARPLLLTDDFTTANGPNGLITNEAALWSPGAGAVNSPTWEMTSGSLFTRGGLGWSGPPDHVDPDHLSSNGTGSAVFRLPTRRAAFTAVRQQVWVRINRFAPGARPWDGVVLWPRYQTEFSLYFAYLLRRDGVVQITKKCPGRRPGGGYYNGGTYFYLTRDSVRIGPTGLRQWYLLATEVVDNPDGSVTIRAYRGGALVARATDRGRGCPPLHGPPRLGIRGDNTDCSLTGYRVEGPTWRETLLPGFSPVNAIAALA